jgi:hypothetical protein
LLLESLIERGLAGAKFLRYHDVLAFNLGEVDALYVY